MKLRGKVLVVTGGGNGMGRELVLGLLLRGAKVFAIDINEQSLQRTVELAGANRGHLATTIADITDLSAVETLPERACDAFGQVDALINNAGIIQPFVVFRNLDLKAIDRVINVNLYGTLYMTRVFLPMLLARPEAHLVNTSSMAGYVPVPGQSVYGATKAAVKLFTEGLISELSETSVKVTVVLPGEVKTNILSGSPLEEIQKKRAGGVPAAKAAQVILNGIERDARRIFVGRDAKIMDWFARISPVLTARLIYSHMRSVLLLSRPVKTQ